MGCARAPCCVEAQVSAWKLQRPAPRLQRYPERTQYIYIYTHIYIYIYIYTLTYLFVSGTKIMVPFQTQIEPFSFHLFVGRVFT